MACHVYQPYSFVRGVYEPNDLSGGEKGKKLMLTERASEGDYMFFSEANVGGRV